MKKILILMVLMSGMGCAGNKLDFEVLFNGQQDISNHWIGNLKGYKVVDGVMVTQKAAGNIYTKKEYQDYVFRFEFKLPPGGNNGLGLRAPHPSDKRFKGRDVAYNNFELQILDDSAPKYKKLKDWQFHGSAYGIAAAKKGALKPVGEWNVEEVYYKGNHLKVTVNGTLILDVDVSQKKPGNAGKLAQGRNRAAGHVAFAGHGSGIAFRNVSIAVLEDDYTVPTTADNVAPEGFTALFNGKDLSNWQGVLLRPNDKPHVRAKLKPAAKASLQVKANKTMKAHWSITDKGELFFDGKKGGFSLATMKKYGNFEFHVSWKIATNSDSGIYLRGLPQVQIWDTENKKAHKHGADKGSGGLWNNKATGLGRWPLVMADKPAGQWNHFYIRMVEDRISIWLNSKLIVNDAPLENLWQKGVPIPTSEQIELQCHGDPVWFKNIYIKELSK